MIESIREVSSSPQALEVRLAKTEAELEQVFRLRYKVFIEETKNLAYFNESKKESDSFDDYCDHLIVKDLEANEVVGTYRLLPGKRIANHSSFYSETEFDLSHFPTEKESVLELGRSCIAQEYRSGKAIQMLWDGIAQYIATHEHQYLIGCASIHVHHGDELNEIYSQLKHHQVITDRFGVRPLPTHQIEGLQEIEVKGTERDMFRRLPPLMKGYSWLGAEIGGPPAYDPIFQTTDFFIVLDTARMERRYRKHFIDRNRR